MVIRRKRRADEEPEISRPAEAEQTEVQDNLMNRPFKGINALFISGGVSPKRLQIWKKKVKDLGGFVAEPCDDVKMQFTHVLANDHKFLKQHKDSFSKKVCVLKFEWIEDCLKEGKVLPSELYRLEEIVSTSTSITTGAACFNNVRPKLDQKTFSANLEDFEQGTERTDEARLCTEEPNVAERMDEACLCTEDPNVVKAVADTEILNPKSVNLDFDEGDECGRDLYLDKESMCERNVMDTHALADLPSFNKHITGIFREMWDIYETVLGDEWRALIYRKAAIQLEKLPARISSIEDVKHISGIGNSVIEKIKEILCTGQLQKLESLKADPKVQILQRLASVWGVGPKLAQKLYQAGHRTVEDLVKEPSLSQMARIGVKYYKDLAVRIPRDEVAAAEKFVQSIAEKLCPGVILIVAGSYRRGNSTCGDIDFLATHPDGYSHRGFLIKLVKQLQSTGFITDAVHCTDHASEGTKKVDTFMGIGRVPDCQQFRRLDIKVYPKEAYAFALVYFTGNDVLNRKIRYAAQRKGYKLNDQGLYLRYGGKKGLSSTECIPCETEEEVFKKIGFPYYEPCDRNL